MDKKDLYNSINQHLESIDDSLKTLAWVQSAILSMNREKIKKLNDTTNKMISSFGALSQNDDNSSDDKNDVPSDALWNGYDNYYRKDGPFSLSKSSKWYSSNRTFTFRNHVTNRYYNKEQSGKKKDGE